MSNREATMNASTQSESQITQLQQENELLLHQLHQVQEELEHYFLLYKEFEAKNLTLQTSNQSNQHSRKDARLFVDRLPHNLARVLRQTTLIKKSILRNSGLFDEMWYLQTYSDVAKKRKNPVSHYLRHGAKEGRNPGPQFDTQWYLANNRDVAETGVNPLLHYIQFGQTEGRQPRPGGVQPQQDPFANERMRLTQARNEQTRLANERQHRIVQLTQASEAARKQVEEQQNLIAALAQERDEQTQLAVERLQLVEQLTVAKEEAQQQAEESQIQRDEQTQLAVERLQLVEQLTVAKEEAQQQAEESQIQRDEQARRAVELQQRLNQLECQFAFLTQERDQLAQQQAIHQTKTQQFTLERDEQARHTSELQQRIKQLECQLGDTEKRQSMLNEEMIKAEAQIDLIKDILFEDKVI
jgi:hypothetical protein